MKKLTVGCVYGFTLLLLSCSKSDFLYFTAQTAPPKSYKIAHKIKDLQSQGKVDILWVIDNSASMDPYQRDVSQNLGSFMGHLIKMKLDWKMGLISTSQFEKPFEGFDTGFPFTFTDADPIRRMQRAIDNLGTGGDGIEKTFLPLRDQLTRHPNFLRSDAVLAIFIVTDAPEQSGAYSASDSLKFLLGHKKDLEHLLAYGAFGAQDLGCSATDDDWDYKGSRYEELVKSTNGSYFPLCDKNFGDKLSGFAKDLVKRVMSNRILLKQRPRPETIRLYFHGQLLPSGLKEEGGIWVYNFEQNAIVFHDLDFSTADQDEVVLEFTDAQS